MHNYNSCVFLACAILLPYMVAAFCLSLSVSADWEGSPIAVSSWCCYNMIIYFSGSAHPPPFFSGWPCTRLETLWHEELKAQGKEKASLARVCWRFCQTRLLVAIFSLLITMVAGFVGPVSAGLTPPALFLTLNYSAVCLTVTA